MDLTRPAALLGLALALSLPAVARAQPLIPNPGLTSLMQPQRLDRSRPLLPEDRALASGSGRPNATPCDRRSSAASSAPPSLYGGGSGPGDYGRYIPGAPPPTENGPKKPSPPAAAADRPLYGGNDRPLWNTGLPKPDATAGSAAGKPTSPDETGQPASSTVSGQPTTVPAPVRDRPLWASGSLSGSPDASAPDSSAGGIAVSPCTTSSAPLLPP